MKGLLTSALLGAQQGSPDLQGLPDQVMALRESMTDLPGEVQLLELAAAQSLYERAGVRPIAAANTLPLAPLDAQECCTQAAADLLERIVQSGGNELLFEWLALAARAKRRPPPRLLPRCWISERRRLRCVAQSKE